MTLRSRGGARGSRRADIRHRCASREDGVSFIEVLLVVMLLGVVVVFVGSLFTSVVTSDMARRQAFAQADLARFAEAVRSAPYQACPSGTSYASAVSAVYQPGDARISDTTSYWQGGYAPSSLVPTGFSPACPGGGDLGVQQVTLTVTVGTGVSASTTVLKRNS